MTENGNGNGNGEWKIKPMSVGASALTFFAGVLTHRVASSPGPLPIETLEWILKGGTAAVLLVGNCVLLWMFLQERKAHAETRKGQDRMRDRLDDKIEALAVRITEPLSPVLRKLTKVLAVACDVIRGRAIPESDMRDLEDTPEDGHPVLRPKEKS